MLIEIAHVLAPHDLEAVRGQLAQARFADGRDSAGSLARAVKANAEAVPGQPCLEPAAQLLMGNLTRHPRFRNAALPRHLASPGFARYRRGDGYGPHTDDPLMGGTNPYRADIAVTVFLSDPADYQGGELVVQTEFGEHPVKLAAGHAVVYPASSTHRVETVTGGERLVALTWVQSLVREPQRRAILFELAAVRDRLLRARDVDGEGRRLDAVYANLVRMWAEP